MFSYPLKGNECFQLQKIWTQNPQHMSEPFDEDNYSLDTEGLDDDFNGSSSNKGSRSKRR